MDDARRLSDLLLEWFSSEARSFPWRECRTPYAVLVSEVMLQQTQASRVVAYFERWMRRFTTIEELAKAPLEEVMKAWEGLGYYSRARRLKSAADYIVSNLSGKIPATLEELRAIPGIGSYTAGAILSFAFKKPTPAIDANVIRVFCRLLNIGENSRSRSVQKRIEACLQDMLDRSQSAALMEAFIEFGALVCTPSKPKCRSECPFRTSCQAYMEGVVEKRPLQVHQQKRERLVRTPLIFFSSSTREVLLVRRSGNKVMSGLHEFPFVEHAQHAEHSRLLESLRRTKKIELPSLSQEISVEMLVPFEVSFSHSFTRFHVTLHPLVCEVAAPFRLFPSSEDTAFWCTLQRLLELSFSSGHKKVLESFFSNFTEKKV